MKKINQSFFLIFSLLFWGLILPSCSDSSSGSDEKSSQGAVSSDQYQNEESSIIFSGIDSISDITDSTATLHWSSHSDALYYVIYNISSERALVAGIVGEEETSYSLTSLQPDEAYRFRVRAIDRYGAVDINTNDVDFTTLHAPLPPSSLSLSSPSSSPNSNPTPLIRIDGVKKGDTVKLFSDSSCSTLLGSAVAASSSVEIMSSSLALGGNYQFYATATGTYSSDCSSQSVAYEYLSCPSGYVYVPALSSVGAPDDFCVMKFEAKKGGSNLPISEEEGTPWVSIGQTEAYNACDSLNNSSGSNGTYALISNPEWMAIARNVENVDSNWTGGSVGSGCLFRGNVGGTQNCTNDDSTSAPSGYDGADPDFGSSRLDGGTAQLTLSNGQVIWDFSGNISEWINWELTDSLTTDLPFSDTPSDSSSLNKGWKELSNLDTFPALSPSTAILPSDPLFNAQDGIGRYFYRNDNNGGAGNRGGSWSDGIYAGSFALSFGYSSVFKGGATIGFRCVFRPSP